MTAQVETCVLMPRANYQQTGDHYGKQDSEMFRRPPARDILWIPVSVSSWDLFAEGRYVRYVVTDEAVEHPEHGPMLVLAHHEIMA